MLNFIWFFLWCIPCCKSYCCQQLRIYRVKITSQSWNPKAISKSNLLQKVGYFSWPLLKVPADFKLSEFGNTHGMELISSWDHSSVIGRKQDFCVNIVLISCKTFTISLVFNLKNFKSFTTVCPFATKSLSQNSLWFPIKHIEGQFLFPILYKLLLVNKYIQLKKLQNFTTVSFCNEISLPKFPLISNQTHRKDSSSSLFYI